MTSDPGALLHDGPDEKLSPRRLIRHDSENTDWERDLVEHSRDLLCIHDLQGRLLSVNPSPARLLGYTVEEILEIPMRELVDPQFRDQFDSYLRVIASAGEATGILAVVTRTGEHRYWEYHCTLRTEGVEKPLVRGIAHDVTDRLQAEKALREANRILSETRNQQDLLLRGLQLFRALLDQSNDAIEVVDPETMRLLDVNEKCCAKLGYTRDELLSMTIYDIDPQLTPERLAETREQLRKTGCRILESTHRRKDGTTFPIEVNIRRVQLDREYLVAISRDITERKLRDGRLQEYERVVESLDEMIVVVNRDHRYVLANRAFLRYRRMKKEEDVVGRPVKEILNPGIFESTVKQKLDEAFHGKIVNYEMNYEYPELGLRNLSLTYLPVEGPAGIDRVACVLRDITERRQAEQALRASEADLQEAQRVALMGSWHFDLLTQSVTGSDQMFRIMGMEPPPHGLPFHELQSFFLPESWRHIVEANRKAVETGQPDEIEVAGLRPDGSITWLLVRGKADTDEAGRVIGVSGIAIDITERKRAEQALRESEERLRLAQEIAQAGTFERNFLTGESRWTPEMEAMYGLPPGGFPRTMEQFLELVHPDDRQRVSDLLVPSEQVQPTQGEWRVIWPDGTVHWIAGRWRILKDPQGRPCRLLGMDLDVTKRKQAEAALRESEERLLLAQEAAQIGTFERNLRTGDCRWTPQMEALYGLPPGHFPKTIDKFLELIHVDDREQVRQWIDNSLEFGEAKGEWRVIWPDGTLRWISGRWRVFKDSSGAPERAIGMDFDITARKQVEQDLRQAKERLTEEKLYLEQEIDTELGFENIIGQSKALKAVMESVGRVAATDAAVLLLGETGTGKELIARAIHRLSRRAGNSFIKMNCAAIPSGLLESELFGNEKGAFTGAVGKKIGRLELADKGTIFLDEIGEISLALQPKLLRVLQDQEFERLGGTQTIKVDFRLIAATNRDLAESVRENEFRSDLYYRLNVFPIRLPPLRERRDDIPLLVERFVQKCSRRMNKSITSVPTKTMDALAGWNWPGNVRELENFIERSVILTTGSVLAAPLNELQPMASVREEDDTLKAKEREYILRALQESHGQISGPRGAATRLGLKRTTLQSKLKHLGINPRIPPQGSP